MKLYNETGNLTLVLPVPCQASCNFCFWDKKEKSEHWNWIVELIDVLKNKDVMEKVHSISISGGEPTSDLKLLDMVLDTIRTIKPGIKVVFNTNGFKLKEAIKLPSFKKVVKHVNISRHSSDQKINDRVFFAKMITKEDIIEIVDHLETFSDIDVTLNMVYGKETTQQEVIDMVLFCKEVGANALAMRYKAEYGVTISDLEKSFSEFKTVTRNSCPVCSMAHLSIKGLPVLWKYGVEDTFEHMEKGVAYEFIFNETAKLCYDWSGNVVYSKDKQTADVEEEKEEKEKYDTTINSRSYGHNRSCSGSSCSSVNHRYYNNSCTSSRC